MNSLDESVHRNVIVDPSDDRQRCETQRNGTSLDPTRNCIGAPIYTWYQSGNLYNVLICSITLFWQRIICAEHPRHQLYPRLLTPFFTEEGNICMQGAE